MLHSKPQEKDNGNKCAALRCGKCREGFCTNCAAVHCRNNCLEWYHFNAPI